MSHRLDMPTQFARGLVLVSVLLVAATAVAQEGGLTFQGVEVTEVTGGLGVRQARAAIAPYERGLWRCAGAREGIAIALVIAPSGHVRSASVGDDVDVRTRACLRRVTRGIVFPARARPSTLTLVLRRVYTVQGAAGSASPYVPVGSIRDSTAILGT